MLEYVVVCVIVLFLETTSTGNDKASNMDVKKCYDEILKLIKMHDIPLPLNSRSLKELESGLKKYVPLEKICAIRENVKYCI